MSDQTGRKVIGYSLAVLKLHWYSPLLLFWVILGVYVVFGLYTPNAENVSIFWAVVYFATVASIVLTTFWWLFDLTLGRIALIYAKKKLNGEIEGITSVSIPLPKGFLGYALSHGVPFLLVYANWLLLRLSVFLGEPVVLPSFFWGGAIFSILTTLVYWRPELTISKITEKE